MTLRLARARAGSNGIRARRAGSALSFGLLALGAACRKPPLDEVVYTGTEQRQGAAAGNPGVAPPPPSVAPVTPADVPAASACAAPAAAQGPFTKLRLIEAAGECAVWHSCVFEEAARALESAAAAHRDANTGETLAAVTSAFASAMLSWQRAELFRFGPAARSTEPGGQDLRDLIYAWPVQPECKVDEQTVSRSYETPGFHSLDFAVSPVNGRTLSALEYLWFGSAEQNHCSQFSSINSSGSWAALPATELAQRRRRYAAEAAIDVRARAAQLVEAWAPSGGNFRARLVAAGGDPFNSEQHALNAISNALFYFDLELKDDKLATPLGLAPECSQSACPDAVESTYTDLSMEYIRQNVVGFRRLFEGCGPDYAGIGFDDWLRDVGAGELADRMLASTRGVEAAIDRVPGSLAQALVDNRALPLAVYDAVKVVTDELKTEFVTVLNLELPAAAEGDND